MNNNILIEKKGYVLMLDLLGFREYHSRKNPQEFMKIWTIIKKAIVNHVVKYSEEFPDMLDYSTLFISDTVIITISNRGAYDKSDIYLLAALPEVITYLLSGHVDQGMFFRGAISYGKFCYNEEMNIIMGEALNEAYEWHSSTDWIGVVLSPSAEYAYQLARLEKEDIASVKKCEFSFVKYANVPFKDQYKNKYHPSVSTWIDKHTNKEANVRLLSKYLNIFSNVQHSEKVVAKFENTLNFIRYVLDLPDDRHT